MEGLDNLKELVFYVARAIWKHRWIGVLIAWLLVPIGIMVVDQIENRYKASTKVYIDSTSVLKPLLEGLAIQPDLNSVVRLMVRQLVSRPNVERAIRLMDFDLEVNSPLEMEELINGVTKRIRVGSQGRSNLYTISYIDTDRARAKNMVQILLDIFVEDTLGKTVTESDSAIEFLDAQIEKYDRLLRDAEERREAFKRKNIGLMPKDGATYYSQFKEVGLGLEQARLALAEVENRRDQIKLQLAEMQKLTGDQVPSIVKSRLEDRIEEQERRIDELLLLYTDEHPDVINARQVLSSLLKRQNDEVPVTEGSTERELTDSPVYQELQILLGATEVDISSFQTRVKALEDKQLELQNLVDIVPKIETELERLNRDYQVHKQNYIQLVSRREQAKISEDVEAGGDQVKFRVIEPPYVSLRPNYPNRPLFDVVILIVALGIGYGVSLLISFLQPVFYNQRDIRHVLTTPILGSIRKFDTPTVLRKRRRNLVIFASVNILLLMTAAYLIYLHSNDVVLLNRFGLAIFNRGQV